MKPIILKEHSYTLNDIIKFKKKNRIWYEKDIYKDQLIELFDISYPHVLHTKRYHPKLQLFIKDKTSNIGARGNWIYFPWSGVLIHTINEKDYFKLITNRNQYLITQTEQRKLYKGVVGIVGLSIGSHIALNLSRQGLGNKFKLADFDVIGTTNLNRIHATLINIGDKKIENTARRIWEINPYNDLYLFSSGINEKNINEFFRDPVPHIIFEIIDDFKMKIKLRLAARKERIPVVMFSNVDNNIIIDIERFDLFPSLPLFNGILGNLPERILEDKNIDPNIYAVQMVGKEFISRRAINSVRDIGKKLVGRPQLNSTVIISSGLSAYITKSIISDKSKMNGRYVFKIQDIFKEVISDLKFMKR